MTRPFNGWNSKATCEGGWEFYGRDDKVLPLEVVHAYIKAVNGQDSMIPPEYLRLHPEILKDAGAGGQIITKAAEGTGGAIPPLPPQERPFDPVSASPFSRGSAPPAAAQEPPALAKFDPVATNPYRRSEPAPKPEPARPWWPRHS